MYSCKAFLHKAVHLFLAVEHVVNTNLPLSVASAHFHLATEKKKKTFRAYLILIDFACFPHVVSRGFCHAGIPEHIHDSAVRSEGGPLQ